MGHSVLNLADRAEYFYLNVFVHIWGVELKKPQYIVVQLLNVFCILWFGCVDFGVRVPEGAPNEYNPNYLLITSEWFGLILFLEDK